jgi:chorismate mutase
VIFFNQKKSMKNNKNLRNWLDAMQLSHPLVIAGPCSAETEAQILTIAHQLKDTDATVLRAGIWKPRTRPGNFEGVGEIGLKWLQKAKAETGLLTTTEVANAQHVEAALKHDIDILWIGARTTVSPFIVQELAVALKGTDKPVLIKNPVNPDLSLWLGAVERIYTSDIKNIGVIHRGFSAYQKTTYRNNPEWQIPIELQNRFPDLPLILDPSHIAGKRELVFDICQTALDLNYDGFMIETHPNPDEAWSDAAQQITAETLKQITEDLRIRKETDKSLEFKNELNTLRTQIDVLDYLLIETFSKRMTVADKIGHLKKENNVAVLQSKRWNEILDKMVANGEQMGLSEEFIKKVYKAIHIESIGHQERIYKEN